MIKSGPSCRVLMRLQKDIFRIAAASQSIYPIIQSNSMYDFSRYQDVIGQLPLLKSYSHLCLCFPIHDQSSRDEIIEKLQTAALKLTTAIPLLAGKVINEGSSPGNSGLFKAVPCSLWSPPNTIVRVKDCSDVCPSYNELVDAKGPVSMLNGDVLCPRKAFPASYEETESDPAPVVALQANFIRGGLLLDCATQHNMIDMNGIEQVLHLLATVLRGEEIPLLAIEQGNRDRRNMIRLLSPDELLGDHSHLRRAQPGEKQNLPLEPDSPYRWCNFRFSPTSQARLKTLASDSSSESNSTVPFVSTNDAHCLLLAAHYHSKTTPSTISDRWIQVLSCRGRSKGIENTKGIHGPHDPHRNLMVDIRRAENLTTSHYRMRSTEKRQQRERRIHGPQLGNPNCK